MVANRLNPAFIQHDNAIGMANGGKPMGNYQGCPIRHQPGHGLLDQVFAFRIQSTGRLIQ